MNPAPKDMTITTATWRDGAWHVELPGNREVTVPDEGAVERLVRAEATGSAIRYRFADSTPAAARDSELIAPARSRAPRRSPVSADVPGTAVGTALG